MRRLIAVLPLAMMLAACASDPARSFPRAFPHDETKMAFTYALPACDKDRLQAAAMEAGQPDRPAVHDGATVCVTPAASAAEADLRNELEAPFFRDRPRSGLGIALSGGGSKASSFAMGVLAGLADHGLLDRADYLSSVSGGGYAAYFYYTHRLFPHLRPGLRPVATNDDLFRDCVSDPENAATPLVAERIKRVNHCSRIKLSPSDAAHRGEDIRYQALPKCAQDVLKPGVCTARTTSGLDLGISLPGLAGTLLSSPLSDISKTLFDWGMFTSPSGRTYHDGIGLTYGGTLARADKLDPDEITRAAKRCGTHAPGQQDVLDCVPNVWNPDPSALTFDELRRGLLQFREPGRQLPFWIINAAAPKYRGPAGWFWRSAHEISSRDIFEMSAVAHGSGRYGYVSASPAIHDMTVLDSVVAAAAFFDSNQQVINNRFVRPLLGSLQHVTNFDWGYDIANYNVDRERRRQHRMLPIGVNWLAHRISLAGAAADEVDRKRSVFIRLIDGGNAENLGVYALLKRGVRNIVVSDAALDTYGQFEDVCHLALRLAGNPDSLPQHVYIPGLHGLAEHCKLADDLPLAYDVQDWLTEHPVLFGCIRRESSDSAQPCHQLGAGDVRLFIVKPAINHGQFARRQMAGNLDGKVSDCYARGVDTLTPASLLNCDVALYLKYNHEVEQIGIHGCPIFPQHSTVTMTANSSSTLYVAYRELARQYVGQMADTIKTLLADDRDGTYERILDSQAARALKPEGRKCGWLAEPAAPQFGVYDR